MSTSSSDKKQVILDNAQSLFARKGFDSTSTREIAETAGVNVAMISYYFGSKENLLKAVIERYGNEVLELLKEKYNVSDDPLTRMHNMLHVYVRYSFTHPEPIVIAHREMGVNVRPDMQDSIHCVYRQIKEMISSSIQEGQQSGHFREVDVNLFMFFVGGMMDHLVNELHTMSFLDVDLSEYGLSTLDDDAFRDRFESFIRDLIGTYLKKK